jgi:GNAT superfamily N-acetyltransferase
MPSYHIKQTIELSDTEIRTILILWNIAEWLMMEPAGFRQKFERSEFYLLQSDSNDHLLAVARINHDFGLRIQETDYSFAEFVGLVSARRSHGYGTMLVEYVVANLKERGLHSLGFCSKSLRPFYLQCGLTLLQDVAVYVFEQIDENIIGSTDDDIIVLNLPASIVNLLSTLDDSNTAFLVNPS